MKNANKYAMYIQVCLYDRRLIKFRETNCSIKFLSVVLTVSHHRLWRSLATLDRRLISVNNSWLINGEQAVLETFDRNWYID